MRGCGNDPEVRLKRLRQAAEVGDGSDPQHSSLQLTQGEHLLPFGAKGRASSRGRKTLFTQSAVHMGEKGR